MVDTPVSGLCVVVDVAMVNLMVLAQKSGVEYPTNQLVVT